MNKCHRCPRVMGCTWPDYCLYPPASWASDGTGGDDCPEWVKEYEDAMDRAAR